MQKLISFAAAAVMVASGLVAATGTAASAGEYGPTVRTNTRISAPDEVERCDSARIAVRVTSPSDGEPRGKVLLKVRRNLGGFLWTSVEQYRGERVVFRTPELCKRKGYTIRAKFERKPGSRWQDSDNVAEFKVTRR